MNDTWGSDFCENQLTTEGSLLRRLGRAPRRARVGNPALAFVRRWLVKMPKQHKTTLPRPTRFPKPVTFRQFTKGLFRRP